MTKLASAQAHESRAGFLVWNATKMLVFLRLRILFKIFKCVYSAVWLDQIYCAIFCVYLLWVTNTSQSFAIHSQDLADWKSFILNSAKEIWIVLSNRCPGSLINPPFFQQCLSWDPNHIPPYFLFFHCLCACLSFFSSIVVNTRTDWWGFIVLCRRTTQKKSATEISRIYFWMYTIVLNCGIL